MAFPPEWKDDQTMDVLFSPFRDSREVNPNSWDKKQIFWHRMILDYCREKGIVSIDSKQLPRMFERKGKVPVCLDKVVEELLRQRKLQKIEDFTAGNSTWLEWSLNWAIKKPASWTINTFVKKPLSWTFSRLTGYESCAATSMSSLVVIQVLQERADLILLNHHKNVSHETTDCVVGYDDLYNQNKDLFFDQHNFHTALLKLVSDKKCAIFETEKHHKVVRFAKTDKRSVTPPNDCDTKIYKLKKTESVLQKQIENLTLESNSLRDQAKVYLRKGLKPSALNILRKKKKIESIRSQKETALENLYHLITAIQQADSNKMVLDAYSSGSEAFKQISKDYGISPDVIDDIMIDMEETFDMQDDINKSLSRNPASSTEPSVEELEEELSFIISGDDSGANFGGDLPEVPQHEPVGFTNISPGKGEVAGPQQELVDALCRMKVAHPDEEDLVLPDVPDFSLDDPSLSRIQRPVPTLDPHQRLL